jgi:hypothetical protein
MMEQHKEKMCNFCGETCEIVGDSTGEIKENSGLIDANVSGGYGSTPGNGNGTLDDCTKYTFSLCEWCLDWLFEQFKTPPTTSDYMSPDEAAEPYIPAVERVTLDSWRVKKKKFFDERRRRMIKRHETTKY